MASAKGRKNLVVVVLAGSAICRLFFPRLLGYSLFVVAATGQDPTIYQRTIGGLELLLATLLLFSWRGLIWRVVCVVWLAVCLMLALTATVACRLEVFGALPGAALLDWSGLRVFVPVSAAVIMFLVPVENRAGEVAWPRNRS